MRKSTRIVRKYIATFLIVLMSIESFGAVVSDNDGSAFITKAEFDSLKNNFQSQIDQYNTSIDSKVDGAISSYLAGINVAKETEERTIYAPSFVRSLTSTDYRWSEGTMDMTLYGSFFRYGGPVGVFKGTFTTENPTNFKEALIKNVDYTNGSAAWHAYSATKQYVVGSAFTILSSVFRQSGLNSVYVYTGGSDSISDSILTNSTSLVIRLGAWGGTPLDSTNTFNVTNFIDFPGNQASFRRAVIDDNANFKGALILNQPSLANKFNNNDEFRDWVNDTTSTGHTVTNGLGALSLVGTAQTYTMSANGSGIDTNLIDNVSIIQHDHTGSWSGSRANRVKPYFGFVRPITDWNQIYIDAFDNMLGDVLLDSDPNKSTNTLTDSYGDHLKLGAGWPIIKADAENKITYEFSFADTSQDYWVWIKEGSFDSSKGVDEDKTNCIKTFGIKDTTTTYNTTHNCLEIKNGKGKVKWTMNNKAVVFIKWAHARSRNAGGGTLIPASKCMVER